jgi:hypothetical protein
MKQTLLIIAIISLSFGCAPPNKSGKMKSQEQGTQTSKTTPTDKQFDVGTCSLVVKDHKIIEENNEFWLKGTVEKVNGYGSSFPEVINHGQAIQIKLNKKQAKNISKNQKIICLISAVQKIDLTYFELVKTK